MLCCIVLYRFDSFNLYVSFDLIIHLSYEALKKKQQIFTSSIDKKIKCIKLNVDRSFRDEHNSMGGGGVFRDYHGVWQCGFCSFSAGGNPLMAEAMALHDGLECGWQQGYKDLIREVDRLELISSLVDHETVRFMLAVLEETRNWIQKDWNVVLTHVSKDCNGVGDRLARLGAESL